MTGIRTNNEATAALGMLRRLTALRQKTTLEASTGLRVSKASDDAAYWSIAKSMTQQKSATKTVQDSLSLGSGVVDVASEGMHQTLDLLNQIKDKLVLASEPSVDRTQLQSQISGLAKQIQGVAQSASYNGVNLLDTSVTALNDTSSVSKRTAEISASANVDKSGNLSIGQIGIDTATTSLFNSDGGGILDSDPRDPQSVGGIRSGSSGVGATGTTLTLDFQPFRVYDDVTVGFDLQVNGGATQHLQISRSTVDAALGTSDGDVKTAAAMAKVLQSVLGSSGLTASVNSGGALTLASNPAATLPHGAIRGIGFSNVAVNIEPLTKIGISDIDVSANPDKVSDYMSNVESMISKVTTGAATLGAIKSRIDMQDNFLDKMTDNLDKGIGRLVDANMEQVAVLMTAQDVQQKLATNSLHIANEEPAVLLQLFKR